MGTQVSDNKGPWNRSELGLVLGACGGSGRDLADTLKEDGAPHTELNTGVSCGDSTRHHRPKLMSTWNLRTWPSQEQDLCKHD